MYYLFHSTLLHNPKKRYKHDYDDQDSQEDDETKRRDLDSSEEDEKPIRQKPLVLDDNEDDGMITGDDE